MLLLLPGLKEEEVRPSQQLPDTSQGVHLSTAKVLKHGRTPGSEPAEGQAGGRGRFKPGERPPLPSGVEAFLLLFLKGAGLDPPGLEVAEVDAPLTQ